MSTPPSPIDGQEAAGAKIAKEAGLTVGWNVLGSVLRFLSGILIIRLYSVEWLGVYAIAHSIVRITADVGNLGLDQGLVRYVSRLHALGQWPQLVATLRQGLGYALAGGVAVGGLLWLAAQDIGGVLLRSQETQLGWMIHGFAFVIPLMTVAQVLAAATQGLKRLGQRAIALDVLPPLVLCVGVLTLHGRTSTQNILTLSFVASQFVSFLATLIFLNRLVPIRKRARTAPEPGLLSYSLPLMLTGLLSNTARWGDVILLGLFGTAEATGLYQFAARIAGILSIVTTSVVGIFAPIVSSFHARTHFDEIRRHLRLVSRWCFSFAWPALLFLAIYGSQTLLVFGKEFPPAASTLVVLTCGHLLWSLVAGNMMLLSMTGYPRLNLLNMSATVVVSVALSVYLIPRLGAIGAALAVMASLVVWALLQTVEVWHIYRTLQFSRGHLKPLAAGTLAATISLPIEGAIVGWGAIPASIVAAVTFAALYGSALWALGFDPQDREILATLRRRPTG